MKILLLTTEPTWKTWDIKLSACRGGLGLVKNIGKVQIDLEEFKGKEVPTIQGKVDRAWFNVLTMNARARGYQAVVLHMGEEKAKKWGVKQTLRGCTINDEVIGEMYIMSNENTKIKYDSGRVVNRFVKVFLHEMSHWMAKTLKQEDKTHYWDYERECVFLSLLPYKYPQGFIDSIVSTVRKEKVTSPITFSPVTQAFGEKNSLYTSGIHAGVDVALPVGTPIKAPTDGEVTVIWNNHKDLGNACLFEWHYNGLHRTMRIAHLKVAPTKGEYRRGDVIALSGNTGKSSGPHVHLENWRGAYDIDILNSASQIKENLEDPVEFFRKIV